MADNVLIHDSADRVPPTPPGRHPLTPISGADFERPKARMPAQLWLILAVACLAPLALLLWGAYTSVQELLLLYPWLSPVIGGFLVLLALSGLMLILASLGMRSYISMQQARIIRTRHGVPVDVMQQVQLSPAILEQQAIALELARAPYLMHPNLSTLSNPGSSKATEALALPAPEPLNRLSFEAFWQRLDEAAHIGIFGMSQSGKTTLARALLNAALERGDRVMAISLAADRIDWPIPVIGDAGETAIVQAIAALRAELKRREDGRERDARPIRVFVDELTSATADKDVYRAWEGLMSAFMTRSRHVNMFLIVMAHDNTSGIFATTGKARLIKNFLQVWCVKEQGRRLVRIDDGLTLDDKGRQVRQVWQLDDTNPILERAQRAPHISATAVFLDESRLDPGAPPETLNEQIQKAQRRGLSRRQARREGLRFDNDVWSEVAEQGT